MSRETDELLTAYVDGVTELDGAERRQIEELLERDPAARETAEATRALLGQLRELPPDGVEPAWAKLEHEIRAAVGPDVPSPWWRRWRWLVPVGALTATAAIALLWLHRPATSQQAKLVHADG